MDIPVRVIVPVFNEEVSIDNTLLVLQSFSDKHPNFFFTVVNDGSADNTANKLAAFCKNASNIDFLSLSSNVGKAEAIRRGILQSKEDYICFMDGDNAYSPEHCLLLAKELEHHDVVIGNRNLAHFHQRHIVRHITGEVFNRLVRVLLTLPFTDTQAGIKGFKAAAARELFRVMQSRGFSFDAELLYIARKKGYLIGQIPAHVGDEHKQKPSTLNIWKDSPSMLFDLLIIRWNDIMGKYEK